jgi:hypothetical protein
VALRDLAVDGELTAPAGRWGYDDHDARHDGARHTHAATDRRAAPHHTADVPAVATRAGVTGPSRDHMVPAGARVGE